MGKGAARDNGKTHSVRITDQARAPHSHGRPFTSLAAATDPYIRVEAIPGMAAPDRQMGDPSFAAPAVK